MEQSSTPFHEYSVLFLQTSSIFINSKVSEPLFEGFGRLHGLVEDITYRDFVPVGLNKYALSPAKNDE
jgi:hypothetical protein